MCLQVSGLVHCVLWLLSAEQPKETIIPLSFALQPLGGNTAAQKCSPETSDLVDFKYK